MSKKSLLKPRTTLSPRERTALIARVSALKAILIKPKPVRQPLTPKEGPLDAS